MASLHGKVALITGASSGIGAATAMQFAMLECKLALSGRNIEKLNKTRKSCIETGKLNQSEVLIARADMTVSSDLERLVEEIINHFGKLDILVNNAGISIFGCGAGTDPIGWFDKIFYTNVTGVIQLTQLCLPYLKTSMGSIVNVSGIASSCPFRAAAYCCMSKAALDSYTQCLALELAKHRIRVNSVNPAATKTGIFSAEAFGTKNYMKQMYPLGRIGDPEEVAKAIAFLSSEDSSFTTGQNLNVCGGISITTAGPTRT